MGLDKTEIFTGTIDELLADDELMMELHRQDADRPDLQDHSTEELMEMVAEQNAIARQTQANIDAALQEILRRSDQ